MAATQPPTTISGVVEQVGRKDGQVSGYKIQGRWLDISRFPWEELPLAQVGQHITATCTLFGQDDKPYIMRLRIVSPAITPVPATPNGVRNAPPPALAPASTLSTSTLRIMTRQQAVLAAATFLQMRPDLASTQILLDTAEEIARWVLDSPPSPGGLPRPPVLPEPEPEPDFQPDFVPDPPDEFPSESAS